MLGHRRLESSGLFQEGGLVAPPEFTNEIGTLLPIALIRSFPIVVSTPILHLFAGIRKGYEPVLVRALRREAAVERFNERVIGRLAWS